MRILKNICIGVINIIGIILMLLLKIILGLLIAPVIFFKWLIEVATGLLTFASWISALVITGVYIYSWISGFNADNNTSVIIHVILIGAILILASGPIWLFGALLIFLEWLEEKYYLLLSLPLSFFTLQFLHKEVTDKEKIENHSENSKNTSDDSENENSYYENEKNINSWFAGIKNKDDLKKRYKDLLKIYHPDNQAGDNSTSQQIQNEYEELLKTYI